MICIALEKSGCHVLHMLEILQTQTCLQLLIPLLLGYERSKLLQDHAATST
jgi:hypothetical protein